MWILHLFLNVVFALSALFASSHAQAQTPDVGWPGIEVIDLTPNLKQEYRLIQPVGAFVNKIFPDGPALEIDLKKGDLITFANDTPIAGAQGFENVIAGLRSGSQLKLIRSRETQSAEVVITLHPLPQRLVTPEETNALEQRKSVKVALLIGNQEYTNGDPGKLVNPLNDIGRVGDSLHKLGFTILSPVKNAEDRAAMLSAVQDFAAELRKAGKNAIGFFYYSGHGLSPDGLTNYLLPTGISSSSKKAVGTEGLSLDDITRELQIQAPEARNIVVFDACRDIAVNKGAGQTFTTPSDISGMVIAFSTRPGGKAKDRVASVEGAGPYAAALAEELLLPGQSLGDVFYQVGQKVAKLSEGQEPWTSESNGMSRGIYLNGTLTLEQQALREREARRLARASGAATAEGSTAEGVLLALEALPGDDAPDLEWALATPALVALDWALRNLRMRALFSQRPPFFSATFSRDGKTVLTGSGDGTARSWDVATGRAIVEFKGHTQPVWSAIFSPDGKTVVSASDDKTARLWDASTGHAIAEFKGHTSDVRSAAFSPDGKRLLTGSWDETVRLWEVSTDNLIAVLKGSHAPVTSTSFSPDSKMVVTACGLDNTARLWDATTGEPRAELTGHTGDVRSASFSPDGKKVLTASADKTARLWDATTGAWLAEFKGQGPLENAVFSPDGKTVVTTSEESARLWDTATGNPIAELKGHTDVIRGVSFSPDAKSVLTFTWGDATRVWDASTGELRAVYGGDTDTIFSAAFSPDGKTMMTASYDGTVRLWDATTNKPFTELKVYTNPDEPISIASFSPDGKTVVMKGGALSWLWDVATSKPRLWQAAAGKPPFAQLLGFTELSRDGGSVLTVPGGDAALLWDVNSGRLRAALKHEGEVSTAAFSPDDKSVVTASEDKTARLWDTASGNLVAELKGHTGEVTSAAFSPDGKTVVTASEDKTARLWDAATGNSITEFKGHTGEATNAAFSPDGKTVLTLSKDGYPRLWDTNTSNLIAELVGAKSTFFRPVFSPDGKTVVTTYEDKAVQLWDTATGKVRAELTSSLGSPGALLVSALFSPNGKVMLTDSLTKGLQLWDVATGHPVAHLGTGPSSHTGGIDSGGFSPDGKLVIAPSGSGARMWDTGNGNLVTEFPGHTKMVVSASFSPDGESVVTLSQDQTARLWAVLPTGKKLAQLARQAVPVCLTRREREGYALPEASPPWCVAMKKWPYVDEAQERMRQP